VDLIQVPFEEMFVAKGTGTMLVWADMISVTQMDDVVMRCQGLHLSMMLELIAKIIRQQSYRFEFLPTFVAFPVSAHFAPTSTFSRIIGCAWCFYAGEKSF